MSIKSGDAQRMIRQCPRCGWRIAHALIWCKECGGRLQPVKVSLEEFEAMQRGLPTFTKESLDKLKAAGIIKDE